MTNAQIIFNESIELMENGIIGNTGRKIIVENEDGEKKEMLAPESIHTYAGWKAIGRQVKKGEKEKIKSHAESRGESLNGFVNRAIRETIQRDTNE